MSEQDFQDLLAAIERLEQEVSTSEQAVEVLKREGYLDENGTVAAPYAAAQC